MNAWIIEPPDERAVGPDAWLKFAQSCVGLVRAGHGYDGVLLEDLCFQAHQAAERVLKGVLLTVGVEAPRTHSIALLLTLVEQAGFSVPEPVKDSAALTPYSVRTRTPGGPEVTEDDYREALQQAEKLVAWAATQIQSRTAPQPG
ncbi:MAG TPA: HEPN domain-containing protein [Phycisphaerae bacterium]|jgi:HEPN domain-containing protein